MLWGLAEEAGIQDKVPGSVKAVEKTKEGKRSLSREIGRASQERIPGYTSQGLRASDLVTWVRLCRAGAC